MTDATSHSRCMVCGKETADGRHICISCERENEMQTFKTEKPQIKTNGDRVRSMTNAELVKIIPQLGCLDPDDLAQFLDGRYTIAFGGETQ